MSEFTAADIVRLLRARYTGSAKNGAAWAFITNVGNATGWGGSRTADAIAMSLWPSRGLLVHGFEIKVSRGDWLRELKAPHKAEPFAGLVDRFWVVAPKGLVLPGELPDTWGLLETKGRKQLVCVHEAQPLGEVDDFLQRTFVAAMMRRAVEVGEAGPAEIEEAVDAERARLIAIHEDELGRERERYEVLAQSIRDFEQAAELKLSTWRSIISDPEAVGAAVRLVLRGEADVERIRARLISLARQAREIAETTETHLAEGTEVAA